LEHIKVKVLKKRREKMSKKDLFEIFFAWEEAKKMKRQRVLAARAFRKVFDLPWADSHKVAKKLVAGNDLSIALGDILPVQKGTVLSRPYCFDHPHDSWVSRYTTPKGREIEVAYGCSGQVVEMAEIQSLSAATEEPPLMVSDGPSCPACGIQEDSPRIPGQSCEVCGDCSGSIW
jgi:hypothetical protein